MFFKSYFSPAFGEIIIRCGIMKIWSILIHVYKHDFCEKVKFLNFARLIFSDYEYYATRFAFMRLVSIKFVPFSVPSYFSVLHFPIANNILLVIGLA